MAIAEVNRFERRVLHPFAMAIVQLRIHPTLLVLASVLTCAAGGISFYYAMEYPLLLLAIPAVAVIHRVFFSANRMIALPSVGAREGNNIFRACGERMCDIALIFGLAFASYTSLTLSLVALPCILLNSYVVTLSDAVRAHGPYRGFLGRVSHGAYLSIAALTVFIAGKFYLMNYFLAFLVAGMVVSIIHQLYHLRDVLLG